MPDPTPTAARFDGLVRRVSAVIGIVLDETKGPLLDSFGGVRKWLASRVLDAAWAVLHARAPVMAGRAVDAVYETWGRYSVADLMNDLDARLKAHEADLKRAGFTPAAAPERNRLLNELRTLTGTKGGFRVYPDPDPDA